MIRIFEPFETKKRCVAIGNFDGVHLGHQTLLKAAAFKAQAEDLTSTAVTFEPHPKEFFRPWTQALARVNNALDKFLDIEACGIDELATFKFDIDFSKLSPEAFVEDYLVNKLHAEHVFVGDDFHFGAKGVANAQALAELGARFGFQVHVAPTCLVGDDRASSTRLRQALQAGDMDAARDLLGVRYHITGEIVHGAELGRTIGFPTINMDALPVNADGFPVLEGVYAVFVHGLTEEPLRGVASITTRPTVTEAKKYLLETHIFEYTKDCYGAFARIEFVRKIRNADKFDDLSALTRAITNDALTAKQMLEDPSTTPSITRFTLSKDALKTIF